MNYLKALGTAFLAIILISSAQATSPLAPPSSASAEIVEETPSILNNFSTLDRREFLIKLGPASKPVLLDKFMTTATLLNVQMNLLSTTEENGLFLVKFNLKGSTANVRELVSIIKQNLKQEK